MPNSKQKRYEGFLKRQSFETVCKYATMGLMRIDLLKTKIHHQEKILNEICLKMIEMKAYFSHSDSKKLETIGFRRKKHEFAQKSKCKTDAKIASKMSKIHRKTQKNR